MGWQTIKLPKLDAADAIVDGILVANDTAVALLRAAKTIVEAASALTINVTSIPQVAIQAAAKILLTAIDDLLSEANPGIYILLVPPRGVPLIPPAAKLALSSAAVPPTPKDIVDIQSYANVNASVEKYKLLRALQDLPQGNAGFVRTVLDSLSDVNDASRPTMGNDDYIAGLYLVTGAASIGDILATVRFFQALLLPNAPQSLMLAELPVPRGLTARVATASSVLLEWELQLPAFYIEQYKTTGVITQVAIIRSTSPQMLAASNTTALFGTTNLTKGLKGAAESEVIDVVTYAANVKSYLDTADKEKGVAYYYAASFRTILTATGSVAVKSTDTGFDKISSVAKAYIPKTAQAAARSLRSTPPDWYRTPRVIDVVPGIADLAKEARNFIQQQVNTTSGYGDLIKKYVAILQQQIDAYLALANRIRGAILPLKSLISASLISGSYRAFSGTGGVNYLRKDLIDAFTDTTDPNRPPYDDDQFVTGVVLLASTPTAATFLNQLLGIVQKAASDISAALAQIDRQLSTIEAATFSANMSVGTPPATTSASAALIGEDPSYCYHSYEQDVTFGDNLNPASA